MRPDIGPQRDFPIVAFIPGATDLDKTGIESLLCPFEVAFEKHSGEDLDELLETMYDPERIRHQVEGAFSIADPFVRMKCARCGICLDKWTMHGPIALWRGRRWPPAPPDRPYGIMRWGGAEDEREWIEQNMLADVRPSQSRFMYRCSKKCGRRKIVTAFDIIDNCNRVTNAHIAQVGGWDRSPGGLMGMFFI